MKEKVMCTCEKCGKTMDDGQFYTYKDGHSTELCKKCLTMHIDNWDEKTYLWILEKMDVPYVPAEWNSLRDKAFAKNPKAMNGMSVIGKYFSKMRLKQFRDYGWADTEKLQQLEEEKRATNTMMTDEQIQYYQELMDQGKITEAEYKTYMPTVEQYKKIQEAPPPPIEDVIGANNFYDESNFISEDELPDPAAELTQEDKIYLAVKWGRLYKPNEWIILEKDYNEMMESFDIQDADSKNSLILLCKTNLKANQAIDCGDVDGFQKLSKVSESLRKTAKFTAAQNKKDKEQGIDSIGELVSLCERDGFIPRFATDIPQDKVDVTIKDMKDYTYKLVTQDLGFGRQIEDALKKIQLQKEMNEEADKKQDDIEEEDFGFFSDVMSDEEFEAFFADVNDQKDQDEEMQRRDD